MAIASAGFINFIIHVGFRVGIVEDGLGLTQLLPKMQLSALNARCTLTVKKANTVQQAG